MKITKLTDQDRVLMAQTKEEWINRFFSGAPIDKNLAREGIEWLYTFSGKRKTPRIIFVESPLMAQKVANYIAILIEKLKGKKKLMSEVDSEVRSEVWSEVESEVWSEVWSEVESEVWSEVGSEVWSEVGSEVESEVESEVDSEVESEVDSEVWSEVRSEVWSEVGSEVESEVRSEVESEVGSEVDSEVRSEVWSIKLKKYFSFAWYGGYSDYGWISFYDFFDKMGLFKDKKGEKFRIFRDKILKANIYDMIQLNRFCIVVALPKKALKDQSRRLHNLEGDAVQFGDGYGIKRIHGVRFDKELYEKFTSGKITALEIITHDNQDQKRAMAMAYGNARMVEELKAECVSEEIDGLGNTMRILVIKDKEEPLVFYEAIDPSKDEKVYLRIPPEFQEKTAKEAKVWTFPVMWNEYEKTGKLPEFAIET